MRRTYHAMNGLALKVAVVICGMACTTFVPYALLGLWNRAFGGWHSVFYCYAGSRDFVHTYAPGLRWLVRLYRWFPVPIGVLRHEGKLGLVIASPISEAEFLDPVNRQAFLGMQRRIRLIGRLIGAERISLSGILPGVVAKDGMLALPDSRQTVQRAVCAAIARVVAERFDGRWPPVALIGGAGFIGVPIARALTAQGREVHVVDPREGAPRLPGALSGRPCLLVDCSRGGVIEGYLEQMWPGMIVLNEVFPRPPRRVVAAMAERGIECWHLSGLAGTITPPLPHGYEGAVPCCAAHDAAEVPEVVLTRLTPEIAAEPVAQAA